MIQLIKRSDVNTWKPFPHAKLTRHIPREYVERILQIERLDGIVTLAAVQNAVYVLDGWKRLEAFKQSWLPEVTADIRTFRFDSLREATKTFTELQNIVKQGQPAKRPQN